MSQQNQDKKQTTPVFATEGRPLAVRTAIRAGAAPRREQNVKMEEQQK